MAAASSIGGREAEGASACAGAVVAVEDMMELLEMEEMMEWSVDQVVEEVLMLELLLLEEV